MHDLSEEHIAALRLAEKQDGLVFRCEKNGPHLLTVLDEDAPCSRPVAADLSRWGLIQAVGASDTRIRYKLTDEAKEWLREHPETDDA